MRDFLAVVHPPDLGRFTELRVMRNGEVMQTFFPLELHSALAESALRRDFEGWDVYFGVLPREYAGGGATDTVHRTRVIWADIDNKNVGGTHLASLMRVGALNLQPSIIVDSGNGIHCYWLLRQPEPFVLVQPLMKGLQAAIGSDKVHDAPRVLRLPGTRNHKDCDHRAIDWTPTPEQQRMIEEQSYDAAAARCKPVRLLHFEPDRRYRLSDFDHFTPEEPRYTITPREGVLSSVQWEPSGATAPKFPEGSRNNELTRLAGAMSAKGMKPIEMLGALLIENAVRCSPPLPAAEVERIVRSVSRYARG